MTEDAQPDWRARFEKIFSSLPKEYPEARQAAAEISRAFHQELAAAMGPRLNDHLKTLPQETYEEKRTLAARCNHELRLLRLSIRCPKTGREAILLVDVVSDQYDAPRFRLQIKDERGRRARTYASKELPALELMESPSRQEPLSRWPRRGGEEPRSR